MSSHIQHFQSLKNDAALSICSLTALTPHVNSYREKQLRASQIILESDFKLTSKISRTASGKPMLETGEHISISHTGDWIAMVMSEKIPVAIDIEIANRDISKIKQRYTTDDEIRSLSKIYPGNPEILIWSCKESLFKILNTRAVHFKEQLKFSEVVSNGKLRWSVDHASFKGEYLVNYFIFENLLVTYIDEQPKVHG